MLDVFSTDSQEGLYDGGLISLGADSWVGEDEDRFGHGTLEAEVVSESFEVHRAVGAFSDKHFEHVHAGAFTATRSSNHH